MDNNNPNLNINELIPGEIYLYDYRFIARYPTGPSLNIRNESYDTHEKWKWVRNIQEVTSEQRDWYAACVKADKFVPKEESLKKTKFEVGRWYKIGNPKNEFINIVKIKKIFSNIKIEAERGYFNIKGSNPTRKGWCNSESTWSDIDYIKELSLEEIQQYLPEGHPDKIKKEFILPEKWCIRITKENLKVVGSYFDKQCGYDYNTYVDKFWIDRYFHSKNMDRQDILVKSLKRYNASFADSNIRNGFIEITFEQFKKYVLKKDNYNHFKIGDIVEYIGTETNLSNDTKKDDLQLGYNYIVKSISKNNIELHGKLFYHDINLFKLATDKKFPLIDHPDWKIGDRVEIIDKGKQYDVYSEAFKKLNFKNKKQNRCDNGYKGKIFHVCFHPTQNKTLIAIKTSLNNGGQCLIESQGIKKIDTSSNKVIEIVDDVPTFKSKEKHTTKPIQTQKLKAILIK